MSIKNLKLHVGRKSAGLDYKTSPQRLDTEDLMRAYLVGLIEGDGWFSFSKNGKYIIYEMGIELDVRDKQLLYKVKAFLGIGNVIICKNAKSVRYSVRKKQHLIDIIFPIFDKYPMLSDKIHRYSEFKFLVLANPVYYAELKSIIKSTAFNDFVSDSFQKQARSNLNLEKAIFPNYFTPWLVSFMEAEGCFSFYIAATRNNPAYPIMSFDIGQKKAKTLILAIKTFLKLKPKITD